MNGASYPVCLFNKESLWTAKTIRRLQAVTKCHSQIGNTPRSQFDAFVAITVFQRTKGRPDAEVHFQPARSEPPIDVIRLWLKTSTEPSITEKTKMEPSMPICPHCVRTVASALLESELAQLEDEHVCDRNQLDRIDRPPLAKLGRTGTAQGRGESLIPCSQT